MLRLFLARKNTVNRQKEMNYHYEYSNVSRRMEIVVSKLEMRLLFPEDDW